MLTSFGSGEIWKGSNQEISVALVPHCYKIEGEITDVVLNFYTTAGGASIEFSGDTVTVSGRNATVVFQPIQLDVLDDGLIRYNVAFNEGGEPKVFGLETRYILKTPNDYEPVDYVTHADVEDVVDGVIDEKMKDYYTSGQTDEKIAEAVSAITVSGVTRQELDDAIAAETARTENAYLKTGSLDDYWTSAQTQSAITEATSGITGGLAIYDYDVISDDSTVRGELIDLVSGGTQTAVVVKDGVMYYYRGYDEDKYIFVDYKNITFSNNEGHVRFALFYSVKVDASGAEAGTYGQNIGQSLQGYMYTTSEYLKHEVDKNGFLYSSEFLYDVVPGSTPVVGETYTTIYFAITGMVWWGSDFLTVSVNGSEHTIAWWGSKSWFVDGEVYQEDHTTEAGMTVDFSHIDEAGNGYISISASAMTVVAVPNNGEGGGTSTTTPILASANLQMYRNGEWNSVSAVPNLIYSGASEGILASTIAKVKIGLYNGAYAGNDTFYILNSGISQLGQSFEYVEVSGVSETLTLKSLDYTAVITKDIPNNTYSVVIS